MAGLLGRIGALLTGGGKSPGADTGTAAPEPAPAPATPAGNPFATANQQVRTAATWFIGALGAVAAVLLAGVQLTSVGRLTWAESPVRLSAAVLAAAAAVVAVVVSIDAMAKVFAPLPTLLSDVTRELHDPDSELARMVGTDGGFLGGYPDHRAFTAALAERRASLRTAYAARDRADAALDDPTAPGTAAEQQARLSQTERDVARHEDRVAELRAYQLRLGQILGNRTLSRRFDDARRRVVAAGCVAGLGAVVFAYAANPPASAGESDAAPPRPVGVTVYLTSAGATQLGPVIGDTCARRAASGVPGVLLGRGSSGDEVVVLGGSGCTVTRLTLTAALGRTERTETADTVTTG